MRYVDSRPRMVDAGGLTEVVPRVPEISTVPTTPVMLGLDDVLREAVPA